MNQKIIATALIALTLLIAIFFAGYLTGKSSSIAPNADPPTGSIACTEEALICPDGSAVGREGPNCEFPACPGEVPPVKP